jgi:hypothetical protein
MKLTRENVSRLPLHEQVKLFWRDNETQSERGHGIRLGAQYAFWEDWQSTLSRWIMSLPGGFQ